MKDVLKEKNIPLFEIDHRILDAISVDDIDVTFKQLLQMGMAKPPFNEFAVRASGKFVDNCFSIIDDDDDENPDFIKNNCKNFCCIFQRKEDFLFINSGIELVGIGWRWMPIKSPLPEDASEYEKSAQELAEVLYRSLIVLLATRNAEKITRVNSERASSHKAREDAKRFSTTTIIRIGKITETMRGASSGTGTKTRPHLRRGHIRNQRHGEGLSETKQIFIAPMFVNADENWIAEQKTYKVMA